MNTTAARTTAIAWTHHTINFWWGCTKVSPACKHCYAEEMGRRFGPMHFGAPVIWGDMRPRQPRLEAARAEALKLNAKAGKTGAQALVFVNSMSDWLDDQVPVEWLAFLLETIFLCPNLTFQLLTKRPENWAKRFIALCDTIELFTTRAAMQWLVDWRDGINPPPNVWIGATVENQEWADKRIPHLLKIPASVRFLSCEPLVGQIDLAKIEYFTAKMGAYPFRGYSGPRSSVLDAGIDWVITGGESGGQAAPSHPDHFRSLRFQCAVAGVPFFFKQWGEWLPQDHTEAAGAAAKSYKGKTLDDGTLMLRVGVKTAGNLLDGTAWQQFPQTRI